MFLVDTDVLSGSSPLKKSGREDTLAWLQEHGSDVFVSVLTIAEIRRGIALLAGLERRQKSTILDAWARDLTALFDDRIVDVDRAVAQRAGELLGAAEAQGHKPGLVDACIAATAELNGYVVVTHNAKHFKALGVRFAAPSGGRERMA